MQEKIKTLTIQMTEEEHKEAKVVAAKEGKSLKRIFLDAIARLKKRQES